MQKISFSALAAWFAGILWLIPAAALAAAKTTLPAAESNFAGSILQTILGLLFVVFIIFLVAWSLRRFGRTTAGGTGVVRILGGLSLGPRERVMLVQVGDAQLLLGVAPGRVQTLHVLDRPVPVAPDHKSDAGGFAGRLAVLLKQRGLS